jgi:hypothetical protein
MRRRAPQDALVIALGPDGKLHIGELKFSGLLSACTRTSAMRQVRTPELRLWAEERWCQKCFPPEDR